MKRLLIVIFFATTYLCSMDQEKSALTLKKQLEMEEQCISLLESYMKGSLRAVEASVLPEVIELVGPIAKEKRVFFHDYERNEEHQQLLSLVSKLLQDRIMYCRFQAQHSDTLYSIQKKMLEAESPQDKCTVLDRVSKEEKVQIQRLRLYDFVEPMLDTLWPDIPMPYSYKIINSQQAQVKNNLKALYKAFFDGDVTAINDACKKQLHVKPFVPFNEFMQAMKQNFLAGKEDYTAFFRDRREPYEIAIKTEREPARSNASYCHIS